MKEIDGKVVEFLSAVFSSLRDSSKINIFTIAILSSTEQEEDLSNDRRSMDDRIQEIFFNFHTQMETMKELCVNDPNSEDTNEHHKTFLTTVEATTKELKKIEQRLSLSKLYEVRQDFQTLLLNFLEDSLIFKLYVFLLNF